MLLNLSSLKALSLASILGTVLASPLNLDTGDAMSRLDRRIIGNEAVSLLCVSPNDDQCGLWVSYTNGRTRQSVSVQSGGTLGCAYELLRKHTNSNGFWADVKIFGSAGLNIGYNPDGSHMAVGDATWTLNEEEYLQNRCRNEFGWEYPIDTSKSSESFFANLSERLF